MIEVTIYYTGGKISAFQVKGHAGYAPKGSDIYCAGVSAVCQTALAGLLYHLQEEPEYELIDGNLKCRIPDNQEDRDKAQLILKTMEVGLIAMQEAYSDYMRMTVKEVEDVYI